VLLLALHVFCRPSWPSPARPPSSPACALDPSSATRKIRHATKS